LLAGIAFERYLGRGLDPIEAARWVRSELKNCDGAILRCLDDLAPSIPNSIRECAVSDLAVGMILQEDRRFWNWLLVLFLPEASATGPVEDRIRLTNHIC
jgi:hypothetical protein